MSASCARGLVAGFLSDKLFRATVNTTITNSKEVLRRPIEVCLACSVYPPMVPDQKEQLLPCWEVTKSPKLVANGG